MRGIVRLQEQIAGLLETGADMSAVERQVIAPAPVADDQKSALWLFAHALSGQSSVGEPPFLQTSAAGTNGRAATVGMDVRPGHGTPPA